MVLCPNGSGPAPSAPPYVWITWLDAQSWLGLKWGVFSWAAAFLNPVLQQTSVFCAIEPTQPTAPSDADILAAATNSTKFNALLQYLKDSATWWVWHNVCQCNAYATPGCQPMLDVETSNLPLNTTTANEWDRLQFTTTLAGLTLFAVDIDVFAAGPTTIGIQETASGVSNSYSWTPSGTGWQRFVLPTPVTLTPGSNDFVVMHLVNGGFQMYYKNPNGLPATTGQVIYQTWQYASSQFGSYTPWAARGGINLQVCLGNPLAYTPSPPPAPATTLPVLPTNASCTTQDVCDMVQYLLNDQQQMKQRVDLLQRRLLPFAYILGSTYSGLTGSGSLTVSDILGVVVYVSTVPTRWGYTSDSPRRLIPSVGSVQAVTNDGYEDWQLVHYEHQIILFPPALATIVRYNFKPGVIGSITLIHPEP